MISKAEIEQPWNLSQEIDSGTCKRGSFKQQRGVVPASIMMALVVSNECITPLDDNRLRPYHDEQDFPATLALIASATDRELARYVQFLKTKNQILRSRIKGQIHTRPHERERLVSLGK